jgi:hypothetical protein
MASSPRTAYCTLRTAGFRESTVKARIVFVLDDAGCDSRWDDDRDLVLTPAVLIIFLLELFKVFWNPYTAFQQPHDAGLMLDT